jgi:hypothetical protein
MDRALISRHGQRSGRGLLIESNFPFRVVANLSRSAWRRNQIRRRQRLTRESDYAKPALICVNTNGITRGIEM